jgi:hypothetical protein
MNATATRSCFVAMPVTTPQAYREDLQDPDHFKHVLNYLFTPALKQAGFTVVPPLASGAMLIQASIIQNLERADLVLCDLSGLNPNVFFELGVRTSLDRPVALVKDDRTPTVPFDVANINMHTYNSCTDPWVLEKEVPELISYIGDVMQQNATGNELWRYFGLTKRGTPAEPKGDSAEDRIEAKLDLFMNELSEAVSSVSSQRVASEMAEQQNRTAVREARLSGYVSAEEAFRIIPEKRAVIDRVRAILGRDLRRVTPTSEGVLLIEANRPFTPEQKSQVKDAAATAGIEVVFLETPA